MLKLAEKMCSICSDEMLKVLTNIIILWNNMKYLHTKIRFEVSKEEYNCLALYLYKPSYALYLLVKFNIRPYLNTYFLHFN